MIRAKHKIRHDGIEYAKGSLIEGLKTAAAERLVRLKAAEYVISPEEELQKQRVQETLTMTAEKFKELADALDELYSAEELKREAKDVGVDLAGVSKKDDVIAAIIQQGKADELLEDEEEGEGNGS
ncbi:MAG: hypothetical protein ABS948_11895 [Solibacillus sp.]